MLFLDRYSPKNDYNSRDLYSSGSAFTPLECISIVRLLTLGRSLFYDWLGGLFLPMSEWQVLMIPYKYYIRACELVYFSRIILAICEARRMRY